MFFNEVKVMSKERKRYESVWDALEDDPVKAEQLKKISAEVMSKNGTAKDFLIAVEKEFNEKD